MSSTPTEDKADVKADITWSAVVAADTPTEAIYKGGKSVIEVTGTFDSATVQMQWGSTAGTLSNIDTAEKPYGAKFTTAGMCVVDLPRGVIKPAVSGGGGSQSLKIVVRPLNVRA